MKKTIYAICFALLLGLAGCCVAPVPPSESPSPSQELPSPSPSAPPSESPSPSPSCEPLREYKGIDVSFYQGNINFQSVKDSGVEGVYIRAGQGMSITDEQFESNYEKASEAALLLGFYYYVTAENAEQARVQARRFASLIDGKDYQLRPAMDFEQFSGLSNDELNEISLAFLKELEAQTSVIPTFYTDAYAAANIWREELSAYPLWIAEYGPGPDGPSTTGIWKTWAGYQYSDSGTVPGINAAVDLDVFKETLLIN